jgi:hypothetical protein
MSLSVPHALSRLACLLLAAVALKVPTHAAGVFRAGAAVVDVTPTNFPVIVNAMFEERMATNAFDTLHARSLALDDGQERVVITVVDSCMLPRDLIDQAKELASRSTGLPIDHMLVSATHTHSAPSAMGCLGSRVDTNYARFLPPRIAEAIDRAVRNLAPARVGWTAVDDPEHTHCRRWIRRPDRLLTDPFGESNVRANMHPGYESPDAIGPSGPVDPALSLLSVQTPEGKPISLLANYSMHYYESPIVSADYYGLFAIKVAQLIGADGGNGPFVGIMSQGTSGDQMWMDYGAPRKQIGLDAYAQEVADVAARAYRTIVYHAWVPLAMAQTKLTLSFRTPDEKRLAWARETVVRIGDRLPYAMAEIYAKEAVFLHDRPTAELVLQALRVGDLGIAAIPNEVYGISGLKIKAQSPFPLTFNVELANGSEGYIPPPEQHRLGGYTTWPARTAGLETNAEPKIVETSLHLLEQVSGHPRRQVVDAPGKYAQAVLAAKPVSYWRLTEFSGPTAPDVSGHGRDGTYEGNVAFYLEGPQSSAFSGARINRAAHLAGGWLRGQRAFPLQTYTVELWFWNGLPVEARAVTGTVISLGAHGDQLSIGGTNGSPGRLVFLAEANAGAALIGKSVLNTRTWNHVAVVRQGHNVTVYLDGEPEISGEAEPCAGATDRAWLVGGSERSNASFEARSLKSRPTTWRCAALKSRVTLKWQMSRPRLLRRRGKP